MPKESFENVWAKMVAKAWSDPSFKKRLMSDPNSVFAEYGFDIPAGMTVEVHENSQKTFHLTLPEQPKEELSEEKLRAVAAGVKFSQLCHGH